MIFKTERLILRPLTEADRADLCEILQDAATMYAYEHAFSDGEVDCWLTNQLRRYREDGFGLWAVIRRGDGAFVGQAGITLQDLDGRWVPEIGYLFKRKHWRRGYAAEAAIGCRDFAFQALGMEEIYSIIRDSNAPSRAVAERNGMTVVDRLTKHYYGMDMPHLVYRVKKGEFSPMEKSKVYFSDFRALPGTSVLTKLEKLIRKAGIGGIDFDGKITAIKIHFGEPGNLTFLRPNYAKVVADVIKSLGGKPFLTDCNTLYAGRRKNALEHLESAYENGYSPFATGCHVIIGDGVKGTDDVDVPVAGGEYIKNAHIGRAVMDADIFVSLTHFKGHEATGFGGALKNIGMGCGSRAGKMDQHASGKPEVETAACRKCHACAKNCGQDAIVFDVEDGKARIDQNKCVGCGRCIGSCNFDAIHNPNDSANDLLGRKIAEYSKAVVDGRPHFHISLVMDISPYCDCHGESDVAILPDVGMFASFDPVALDQACVDACLKLEPMPGSLLDDRMHEPGFHDHHDHFINTTPVSVWETTLEQAERIGLGSRGYEVITVK